MRGWYTLFYGQGACGRRDEAVGAATQQTKARVSHGRVGRHSSSSSSISSSSSSIRTEAMATAAASTTVVASLVTKTV